MTKPVCQHEVPNLVVLDELPRDDVVNVGMACRDHLTTAEVGQALLRYSIFNLGRTGDALSQGEVRDRERGRTPSPVVSGNGTLTPRYCQAKLPRSLA
jgi:hypothetical protein